MLSIDIHEKSYFWQFYILGGAIIISMGMLEVAHVEIQAYLMRPLQFLGGFAMLAGIILGVIGLKGEE